MTENIKNRLELLDKPKTTLNNYSKISLYVPIGITCTWKCENCCNIHYKGFKDFYSTTYENIIETYQKNNLVEALVLSGLEPFDNFEAMLTLIKYFRKVSNDDIVIYSGYYFNEIGNKFKELIGYKLLLKMGRYIPNLDKIYNYDLNLKLASNNQYTIYIT